MLPLPAYPAYSGGDANRDPKRDAKRDHDSDNLLCNAMVLVGAKLDRMPSAPQQLPHLPASCVACLELLMVLTLAVVVVPLPWVPVQQAQFRGSPRGAAQGASRGSFFGVHPVLQRTAQLDFSGGNLLH